ncbi:MAG TPA: UDP-N-acetylmuramate dehydrogenase [Candidatus Latescibacteria bacterium]|nr:UDP-N-acetylmuramate dehydrogenase [Candidatus Latescibacterota bacterium]
MAHVKALLDDVCVALNREGVTAERDIPLAAYTTFRIGGVADILATATTEDQVAVVVRVARKFGTALRCIGGGSNLLVSDDGVDGIVLVNAIRGLSFEGGFAIVGAGYEWDSLVEASVSHGLGGIAGMSGIPGTVGGAVCGNAGAYGESVGDRVVSVRVVDRDGQFREIERAGLGFRYRGSALKTSGEPIVRVQLALRPEDRRAISEQRQSVLNSRAEKHPPKSALTAGSFFKNIDDAGERARLALALGLVTHERRLAAGLLLDRAGARGLRVGDAEVYSKHANIIVNRGHATAAEVNRLAVLMKEKVRHAFGVQLQREVIWLGRGNPEGDRTGE